jgi:hypothetical protein
MPVLMFYRVVASAILAAILVALLDLWLTYKLGNDFYGFRWLGMIEKLFVNTTNVTLCWF